MGRNISTLDELIFTACLNNNMLFEARRVYQELPPSASTMQRSSGVCSGNIVTREIQEKCRKAVKCVMSNVEETTTSLNNFTLDGNYSLGEGFSLKQAKWVT
jgi:hypothetical protein